MKEQIMLLLNRIALMKSKPFCYGCYTEAPNGRCSLCGSDDLMRFLPRVGCEYGFDWIIKEILSEIECVDTDERFEESIRDCYPEETKIGWLTYDTVTAMKKLDPISWELAKSEWLDQEEFEAVLVSFDSGNNYYDSYLLLMDLEALEAHLHPLTP